MTTDSAKAQFLFREGNTPCMFFNDALCAFIVEARLVQPMYFDEDMGCRVLICC
jgi:hypothetical protein